jgi:hypothetical protein
MLNVGVCQMTGAMTPVGGPLHFADTRLPTQANKKLIATADPARFVRPGRGSGTRIGISSDQREPRELSSNLIGQPMK